MPISIEQLRVSIDLSNNTICLLVLIQQLGVSISVLTQYAY